MIKNLSITGRLLTLPFFLYGPFMALWPRGIMVWVIYTALVMLPCLKKNWVAIKTGIDKQALMLLLSALGYSVISAVWSPNPKAWLAALDITYMSFCCSILFLTLPYIKRETRGLLMSLFAAGWGIGFFLLLFESFLDHSIHRWYHHLSIDEPVGSQVAGRMAGLFALAVWPFALWLKSKGKGVLSFLAVLAFSGICLFLTNRSALLGMAIGTTVLLFACYQTALARWALMTLMAVGLFFVIPVSVFLPLAPPEITGQLFDSAQERIKIWTATAQHVLEAPVFGHGLDASKGLETDGGEEKSPSGIHQHPHNIFLQLWLDFGGLGAALWGALMLMLADRMRFIEGKAQPYFLGAAFCSLMMLNTTYSILQAWWASGHVASAVMLMAIHYSLSRNTAISGISAGGISNS